MATPRAPRRPEPGVASSHPRRYAWLILSAFAALAKASEQSGVRRHLAPPDDRVLAATLEDDPVRRLPRRHTLPQRELSLRARGARIDGELAAPDREAVASPHLEVESR